MLAHDGENLQAFRIVPCKAGGSRLHIFCCDRHKRSGIFWRHTRRPPPPRSAVEFQQGGLSMNVQSKMSDIQGLTKVAPVSRRLFMTASAATAAGYTLAAGPVRADAIKTDT